MGAPRLKLSSSGQYYDIPRNTPTFRDRIRNYLRYKFEVVTGGLRVNEARLISVAEIYECPNKINLDSERYEPRAENYYSRTFVAFTSYTL